MPYFLTDNELVGLGEMAERVNRYYADVLLQWLLKFYNAARLNSAAELSFLFDIVEALDSKFGNRGNTAKETGVSATQISILGNLANNEIMQGRHRGAHYQSIRDATSGELSSSRSIARSLVLGYISYLERQG